MTVDWHSSPRHIVKLVGGISDGSFMPVYTDDICYITCVINYDTKTAHYYHLTTAEVTDKYDRQYLKTWYQFWTSQEFTKENDQYLEEHSDDYLKLKYTLKEPG